MFNFVKRSSWLILSAACMISLAGCGGKNETQPVVSESPVSESEAVSGTKGKTNSTKTGIETEETHTVDFDVDLMDSWWNAYKSEFLNPAGNLSQDGRGMDEWSQSLAINADGTASWVEMDLETYETTGTCYGSYEMNGNQIILTAYKDTDYSTVDQLIFEMIDGNELKLEYPENNFVYYQYEDLSDWSNQHITRDRLEDIMWVVTSKTECFNACETEPINEDEYYETVTFYANDMADWYIYNPSTNEVLDELHGYWYFEDSNIVISKNEDPSLNDIFDFQYFTYSDGMLHRMAGGAIEYHFEEFGDWDAGLIEASDLYDSYWVLESQTTLNRDTNEFDTLYYPDQSGTIIDLYLSSDGTGTYTCRNQNNNDIFWTVTWEWTLNGTELTLQKQAGAANPYDIHSPVMFYLGGDELVHVDQTGSLFTVTEVFARR